MASVTIILYKNYSSPETVFKNIGSPVNVSVTLKGEVSLERPTFLIESGSNGFFVGYNYLYCPEFGRYYYAKFFTEPGGLIRIECVVDPIYTFKTGITSLNCLVGRQENFYDPYLNDPLLPVESSSHVEAIEVNSVGLASGSQLFLTCIGAVEEEG